MYAYIINNVVKELIPDFDKSLPNVSIEQRYPAKMLDKCVHVEDNADVRVGMIYDPETGKFEDRDVSPISPMPEDIEGAKAYKVAESKDRLTKWLEENPLLYSDGKYYSVTAEKQSLLNSNLASYERAKAAGIDYPLKWNSTGDECTEWAYEALVGLSLTIAGYVAPRVSQQQELEITIMACETIEELDEVVISYE